MSEYKIHRWDAVMGNNNQKVPMIYIKPDLTFMNFIKKNNYTVVVKISGTGTNYDDIKEGIIGVVDKSSNHPNCRPNFFKETGLYVVTLQSNWYGYPYSEKEDKNGNASFYGLHAAPDTSFNKEETDTKLNETQTDSKNSSKGLNKKQIFIVCLSITALFVFLLIINEFTRKKR